MAIAAAGAIGGAGQGISALAGTFLGSNSNVNQNSTTNTQTLSDADIANLQSLISQIGGSNTQFTRANAIADAQGYANEALKTLTEQGLPTILAGQSTAGAYNSTSGKMLADDLTSRTAEQIAANTANTVAQYQQLATQNDSVMAALYQILKGAQTTSTTHTTQENVSPGLLGTGGNLFNLPGAIGSGIGTAGGGILGGSIPGGFG